MPGVPRGWEYVKQQDWKGWRKDKVHDALDYITGDTYGSITESDWFWFCPRNGKSRRLKPNTEPCTAGVVSNQDPCTAGEPPENWKKADRKEGIEITNGRETWQVHCYFWCEATH